MHFTRAHLNGNPYLGIFALASEECLLVPPTSPRRAVRQISETLEIPSIPVTVAGTELVGTFAVSNSKGILLPRDATKKELERLRDATDLPVGVLDSKYNALGNLILTNDSGALVSSLYTEAEKQIISDVLDVEAHTGAIDRLHIVGSLGKATNIGSLVSPRTTDEEITVIKDTLKVRVERGTANLGVGNVGTCILVNSKGAAAGMPTTGIEMGRIQQVFDKDAW
jgi:translation initiation factor 6